MNLMIYLRGNKRDYDTWAEMGNTEWNTDSVFPYFLKSERNQNPEFVKADGGKWHNGNGLLLVGSYGDADEFSENYIKAFGELRKPVPYVPDLNRNYTLGITHMQGTLHGGTRQSTAKCFLSPFQNRTNLHVMKHSMVDQVLMDDGVATGIHLVRRDPQTKKAQPLEIRARKEVILSAGAVNTPQLLLLSGIGPSAHLESMGLPVNVASEGVGNNLQDHVLVPVVYTFKENHARVETQLQRDDDLYLYARHNKGPFTGISPLQDLSAYVNTQNSTGYPDYQVHFFHFRAETVTLPIFLNTIGMKEPMKSGFINANKRAEMGFALLILLNPESRGSIRLNTTNPLDHPIIDPGYFRAYKDLETERNAVRQMIGLVDTPTFKSLNATLVRVKIPNCDKYDYLSDDYIDCYSHEFCLTLYHPCGTCSMGPDSNPLAVVDQQLRLKGVKNLRVIDASVMPKIPSCNTNAPTIMVGEKGADYIKQTWLSDDDASVGTPFDSDESDDSDDSFGGYDY